MSGLGWAWPQRGHSGGWNTGTRPQVEHCRRKHNIGGCVGYQGLASSEPAGTAPCAVHAALCPPPCCSAKQRQARLTALEQRWEQQQGQAGGPAEPRLGDDTTEESEGEVSHFRARQAEVQEAADAGGAGREGWAARRGTARFPGLLASSCRWRALLRPAVLHPACPGFSLCTPLHGTPGRRLPVAN